MSSIPTDTKRRPFGERLLESGLVTRAQLQMALAEQQRTREPIGKILVALGLATQDQVNTILFEDAHVECIRLRGRKIDRSLVEGISLARLRELSAVPIEKAGDTWTIAVADPADIFVADALANIFRGSRRIVGASRSEILESLRDMATTPASEAAPMDATKDAIHALDNIFQEALARRATDIHFEPDERLTRIRYRVDGVLISGPTLGNEAAAATLSRLKLLSGLDISIKRMPQDGRFRYQGQTEPVDCRVSTLPTIHGENAVVRILDCSQGAPRLATLDLVPEIEKELRKAAGLPHGILYVAGATGSGKTTTLYALLASIDAMQRKVCTVEDPVEYRLPLARQTQVQPEIGFDFASALRALLRQDPDVILIGETRDQETAEIGLRAALTGHLVMSTLHANRAAAAAARLIQMGVDPFLLASTLSAVYAQTLLRRVCKHCSEFIDPSERDRRFFTSMKMNIPNRIVRAKGCEQCNLTGYHGRTAVGELLLPNVKVIEAIQRKENSIVIHELAVENGLVPLERAAVMKAAEGITTIEEAARVIGADLGGAG
ncbi:MAG: GspE/PulE family protein [Planctomycetota bacterium]